MPKKYGKRDTYRYVETITINKRIVNMGNCSLNMVDYSLLLFALSTALQFPFQLFNYITCSVLNLDEAGGGPVPRNSSSA